jgi:hypothetical protein
MRSLVVSSHKLSKSISERLNAFLNNKHKALLQARHVPMAHVKKAFCIFESIPEALSRNAGVHAAQVFFALNPSCSLVCTVK